MFWPYFWPVDGYNRKLLLATEYQKVKVISIRAAQTDGSAKDPVLYIYFYIHPYGPFGCCLAAVEAPAACVRVFAYFHRRAIEKHQTYLGRAPLKALCLACTFVEVATNYVYAERLLIHMQGKVEFLES